jgi:nucleoid-associated protein EbfC
MKDIMGIMKQVQGMQAKMADMQTELENAVVDGQSGGGMVKVTLTGKGALKSVSIDPSLMNKDEIEILEDLIVAAHNDAKGKSEAMMAEKMKGVTGGLPLPPGFKLPF